MTLRLKNCHRGHRGRRAAHNYSAGDQHPAVGEQSRPRTLTRDVEIAGGAPVAGGGIIDFRAIQDVAERGAGCKSPNRAALRRQQVRAFRAGQVNLMEASTGEMRRAKYREFDRPKKPGLSPRYADRSLAQAAPRVSIWLQLPFRASGFSGQSTSLA